MLHVAYLPATRPKAVLCAFFVGADDWPRLKAALPGWAILATDKRLLTPSATGVLAEVRRLKRVDVDVPVYLAGFSAGVQSVRYLLLANAHAFAGAASFDGAHARFPEPIDFQVDVWKKSLARAEAGDFSLIMTATSLAYVESLPAPYMSTRHVIERVLDLPPEGLKMGEPVVRGRAYFRLYDGANAAAHAQQQNNVMPELLAKLWAPLYAAPPALTPLPVELDLPAPSEPVSLVREGFDPLSIVWPETLSLRWRLLRWMLGELTAGVREVPDGSNDGPRIREYRKAKFYRDGKPHRAAPGPWCLMMIAAGLEAVAEGDSVPTPHVAGIEYQNDAIKEKTWISLEAARAAFIAPRAPDQGPYDLSGYVCIAGRSTTPGGWERHGMVVATPLLPDGSYATVAGNESNKVGATWHNLNDAKTRVLGFVRLP
mgnify:CR=1 FL=1